MCLLAQEATRSDLAKKDRHRVFLYREKTKAALIIQLAWRRLVKGRVKTRFKFCTLGMLLQQSRMILLGDDADCLKILIWCIVFSRYQRRKAKRELMEARERAQKQMVGVNIGIFILT